VNAFIHTYTHTTHLRGHSRQRTSTLGDNGGRSHIVCVLIYVAHRAFLLPRYRDLSAANYIFMPSRCFHPLFRSLASSSSNSVSQCSVSFSRLVAAILSKWRMDETSHADDNLFRESQSLSHTPSRN